MLRINFVTYKECSYKECHGNKCKSTYGLQKKKVSRCSQLKDTEVGHRSADADTAGVYRAPSLDWWVDNTQTLLLKNVARWSCRGQPRLQGEGGDPKLLKKG